MRNRFSRLLFTSEDRLCANCTYKNNRRIYRHNAINPRSRAAQINCGDVTMLSHKIQWRNQLSITDFRGIVCWEHEMICKKWNNIFVTVNNDFCVPRDATCQCFFPRLHHSWKPLADRLTRDPKIVIHGNLCIILYTYIPSVSVIWDLLRYTNCVCLKGVIVGVRYEKT